MQQMERNCPDVVVVDREKKWRKIVDFSVPWDKNVRVKEDEKTEKYSPLSLQVRRLHGVSIVVVPIVVVCLNIVSDRLEKNLKELGLADVQGDPQISAIIGTANILKKVPSF